MRREAANPAANPVASGPAHQPSTSQMEMLSVLANVIVDVGMGKWEYASILLHLGEESHVLQPGATSEDFPGGVL